MIPKELFNQSLVTDFDDNDRIASGLPNIAQGKNMLWSSFKDLIATIANALTKWATKQDTLVSGTNIKTINSTSILGSGNLDIEGGESGYLETITSGQNIVLTVDSERNHRCIGADSCTYIMPDVTTLELGTEFKITNDASQTIAASTATEQICGIVNGLTVILRCIAITGTGAASWEVLSFDSGGGSGTMDHAALTSNLNWVYSGHTGAENYLAGFDDEGEAIGVQLGTNLSITEGVLNATGGDGTSYNTTATAAGTSVLDVDSKKVQFFTGTTTQTVQMPDVTTLTLGRPYKIRNKSTGLVSIVSSGSNAIISLRQGETVILTCIAITGTTETSWDAMRENAGIEFVYIACSDLTTALTTGTNKAVCYFDFNFKLLNVYGSLITVCTGSTFIFDINNGANSFLTDKLSIDASENTSGTAATPATINATYENYVANSALGVDFDQVGATIAGAGAGVLMRVKRT